LIFALGILVKLLCVLIKPKAWLGVVKKIYMSPVVLIIIELILAGIVFYYLNQAGITIVQIAAIGAFVALLMGISLAAYLKDAMNVAEKLLKDKAILKKTWLAIIIWLALAIWVLYALFA
jgi:amino acid transporter